jgi:group I intron endonuclease
VTKIISGIYCITNKINNKKYIGQSNSIFSRWSEHYRTSKNNSNRCSIIHQAINKYGVSNFTFEILELCDIDKLNELEIFYIKSFKEQGYILYNVTEGGDGGNIMYGEDNPNSILTNQEVYDIREQYNNHTSKHDVYNIYQNKITFSGFCDIWCGKSRKDIHMDVYTTENKDFHKHNFTKDLFDNSNFTEEDVKIIRNLKQKGLCRKEVYEKYKWINLNTFNDIWYYHTFKNITSNLEKQPTKYIRPNQEGLKNHMSKFTEEQILDIRRRKQNGEKLKDVHKIYSFVCLESIRKIWNNQSYKEIQLTNESD